MTNVKALAVGDKVRYCGDTYEVTSVKVGDVYAMVGLDGTVERFKVTKSLEKVS